MIFPEVSLMVGDHRKLKIYDASKLIVILDRKWRWWGFYPYGVPIWITTKISKFYLDRLVTVIFECKFWENFLVVIPRPTNSSSTYLTFEVVDSTLDFVLGNTGSVFVWESLDVLLGDMLHSTSEDTSPPRELWKWGV
jgi:hypothetical protein